MFSSCRRFRYSQDTAHVDKNGRICEKVWCDDQEDWLILQEQVLEVEYGEYTTENREQTADPFTHGEVWKFQRVLNSCTFRRVESESEKQKDINEELWKKREETMQVVYCARSILSVV